MTPKIDILIFGAHPDDIELGCGGTILSEIEKGKTVGLVDLTAVSYTHLTLPTISCV